MNERRRRAVVIAEPSFLAAGTLAGLRHAGIEIVALISERLPKSVGGAKSRPVPPWKGWNLGALAKAWGIRVQNDDAHSLGKSLASLAPIDCVVCSGTHLIVPADVYSSHTVLNLHPSLLPLYRGAAPQLAMLLRGDADRFGGLTLHVVGEQIDAGPVIVQRPLPRSDAPDGLAWRLQTAQAAYTLARRDVPDFLDGRIRQRHCEVESGSYVSAHDTPVALHATMSFEEVRSYIRTISGVVPRLHMDLEGPGTGRRVVVGDELLDLGPPTGDPPQLANRRLEIDLSDRRVALLPSGRPRRVLRNARRALRLLTTPYAARNTS